MEFTVESAQQINQARFESEVSVRVAKKTLDAQKAEGEAAISLLKAAASTAKSTAAGGTNGAGGLDVLA